MEQVLKPYTKQPKTAVIANNVINQNANKLSENF